MRWGLTCKQRKRSVASMANNTIAVRVPDDTYAKLRDMADAEHLRVSDIVRRLLREALHAS